ncbi:MAG: glutathione S-transferase family protein [Dongiaceae bacterium]
MLTLYHAPQSRSIIAQWMLVELGEPFDYHLLDLKKGDNRTAAYLAINPMGKVPTLDHDGSVVTEAAAICSYLADAFPKAGLAIPIGDRRRGPYLKWLFYGPSCLEPAVIDRMFQRPDVAPGSLGYGDFERVMEMLSAAVGRGPYLMGDSFTAADVVIGSGLIWGMMTKAVPARPEILAYTDRLQERPGLRRVYEQDAAFVKKLGG